MPNARHIHTANPIYSQPVLRAASPTNTITTEYGADDTSLSDRELDEVQFAAKVEMNIGIRQRDDSMPVSGLHVLLPKPRNGMEEKVLYDQVMRNLRQQVKALEDEELFESTTLANLLTTREQQPTSYDIDEIMQSLMGKKLDDDQGDDPRMVTDQPSPTPGPAPAARTSPEASTSTVPGTRRQTRRRG